MFKLFIFYIIDNIYVYEVIGCCSSIKIFEKKLKNEILLYKSVSVWIYR